MQNTVHLGLRNCKIYHPKLPDFAMMYLVELGNEVNEEAEATTFLQVYRSTEKAEAGFLKMKNEKCWTNASIGQWGTGRAQNRTCPEAISRQVARPCRL